MARCVGIVSRASSFRLRGSPWSSARPSTRRRRRYLTDVRGLRGRRGASISWVDGDVSDGIRPSHCERGEVDI